MNNNSQIFVKYLFKTKHTHNLYKWYSINPLYNLFLFILVIKFSFRLS